MTSELRVSADQTRTVPFTNTQAATAINKGVITSLGGNGCGFPLENIGTNGASRTTTTPGANKAAMVVSAELCILDKNTSSSFSANDEVWYDLAIDADAIIDGASATTSSRIVGRSTGAATTAITTLETYDFHGAAQTLT